MGLGFEVTNDQGRKQVLDSAPLLTHTSKIVITNTPYNVYNYISMSVVMAVKPANNNHLFISHYGLFNAPIDPSTGNRYRYRAVGEGDVLNIDYNVQPTSASNFGLEVYNELGEIQFSSEQKPLRVLDMVVIDDIRSASTNTNGNEVFFRKDYGNKEIAVIMIQMPTWTGSPYFYTVTGVKRGNYFSLEKVIEYKDRESIDRGGIISYWKLKALIIDVTNY